MVEQQIVISYHLGVYIQALSDGFNNNPYTDNSSSVPIVSTRRRKYFAKKGRKYTKIIEVVFDSRDIEFDEVIYDRFATASVHAFIDNATGDVLKPAGWKSPAKGVRFNLLNDESRQLLIEKALERDSFTGGYLYASMLKNRMEVANG
jgi:hypothetical protein